nr:MAG TPA: hypothetical protein [Bacteriophage sp.]
MDVLQLVQETLDASPLGSGGVRVYWGRRGDMDPGAGVNEYIVYVQEDDSVSESADGKTLARTATIAIRYYLSITLARTAAGRRQATERVNLIHEALAAAGFTFPSGWVDLGDIDDADYSVLVGKFEFARTVNEGAG